MTIRLGIAGCGLIADAHGIAVEQLGPDVRFVASADTSIEAARRFGERFGCEAHYRDIGELVRHEGLDGIVIATWPADHFEHLNAAIDAGIRHILCEKSLTIASDTAARIWRRAREKSVTILEGFMYLHDPLVEAFDEAVASRMEGRIDWVRARFSTFNPGDEFAGRDNRNWRFRADAGGGAGWDITCYAVNACARYAGALPKTVIASGEVNPNFDTIDRLFAIIEYENGVRGLVESSMQAVFSQQIEVVGPSNRLLLADAPFTRAKREPVLEYGSPSFGTVTGATHDHEMPVAAHDDIVHFPAYHAQLRNFVDRVKGGKPKKFGLERTVVNIATIEAILGSAKHGENRRVELPDDIRQACAN